MAGAKSRNLRLALAALACTSALTGGVSAAWAEDGGSLPDTPLLAQNDPAGRPIRILRPVPAPAPAPAPTPPPSSTSAPAKPVTAAISPAQPVSVTVPLRAADTIVPPKGLDAPPRPGAVILQPGSAKDAIARQPNVRRFTGAELRANPRITVGSMEVDVSPLLKHPRGLPRVAQNLRAQPDLATVGPEVFEAYELRGRGVAVRSMVSYRLKPGVCADPSRRARAIQAGATCYRRVDRNQRIASFSNPASPHYISDPKERARAIAEASQRGALVDQEVKKKTAGFRSELKNPTRRGQLVAQRGAAEISRLEGLSDEDLAGEMINTAAVGEEHVAYIPLVTGLDIKNGLGKAKSDKDSPAAKGDPEGDLAVAFDLDAMPFLTGFTLGKDWEWSKRIETTIAWCWVGCEETYYAGAGVNFGYAFGLRMPLEVGGQYRYTRKAGKEDAEVTIRTRTLNGDAAYYASVGMPADKVYNGQEFVARVYANASAGMKLPLYPELKGSLSFDFNIAERLKGDLAGGNFKPPEPKMPGPKSDITFREVDLLGGRGNFGIAGAKVHPSIFVELSSDLLTIDLRDKVSGKVTRIDKSEQVVKLAIAADRSSRFVLERPLYSMKFHMTPGITAVLFVDIGVWGADWDFPVPFPQLTITLPKDGVLFTCHEGTSCDRDITVAPTGIKAVKAKTSAAGYETSFGLFTAKFDGFKADCEDDICRTAMSVVRSHTEREMKAHYAAGTSINLREMKRLQDEAPMLAKALIADNGYRKAESKTVRAAVEPLELKYVKQCEDRACIQEVRDLTKQMTAEVKPIFGNPLTAAGKLANIHAAYTPKYDDLINRSKRRVAVANVVNPVKHGYLQQCLDAKCDGEVGWTAVALTSSIHQELAKTGNPITAMPKINQIVTGFRPKFEKSVADSKARNPD